MEQVTTSDMGVRQGSVTETSKLEAAKPQNSTPAVPKGSDLVTVEEAKDRKAHEIVSTMSPDTPATRKRVFSSLLRLIASEAGE